MKAFMFFLAFAVVMASVIVYQQQTASLIQSLVDIKDICDNATEAGALSADENCNIDQVKAYDRAMEYLGYNSMRINKSINDCYVSPNAVETSSQYSLTLVYKSSSDENRSPEQNSVTASSIYEWVKK